MKKIAILLCIGLYINCAGVLCGQNNKLIHRNINHNEKINFGSKIPGTYHSFEFIDINLSGIDTCNQFVLEYHNKVVYIQKDKIQFRDSNSYSFFGSSATGETLFLSVLNGNIQGVIEDVDGTFSIETIDTNLYAIIDFDYSELGESSFDSHKQSLQCDVEKMALSAVSEQNLSKNHKIRVLVLYTPAALSYVSDIKNTIWTAIDATNISFSNSNINAEIELVYMGIINYTERGYKNDLQAFSSKNDGNMDAVHTLRDKYSADICVLLTNDNTICGIASDIGVSAENAFCVVSVFNNCATANYSFGHEIGHLLGCRHDIKMDNSDSPFPYGHGYINPSKTWRTIMAYGNDCNNCPRKNYWSNPDVMINGTPTGTNDLQNNARVWNERAYSAMRFRVPENTVQINADDIENSQYANIEARQDMIIKTVNISNGQIVKVKAGNSILLSPGFSLEKGAEFSAIINDIYD